MPVFNLEVLTLGLLLMAAVLRSRPQEAAVPVINYPQLTRVLRAKGSLPVGVLFETPDNARTRLLTARDLGEVRVVKNGSTIERRTFPLGAR
jgi:hypothetical protein